LPSACRSEAPCGRLSSQCLKRHWRVYDGENSLKSIEAPESIRSRVSFDRFIVHPLVNESVNEHVARVAAQKLQDKVVGSEAKREKADKRGGKKRSDQPAPAEDKPVMTAQVTVIGKPELEYLCQLAREAIKAGNGVPEKIAKEIDDRTDEKELKKNLKERRGTAVSSTVDADWAHRDCSWLGSS